jgi:hypothetical protein
MDSTICLRWIRDFFVPTVRQYTSEPVVLLWDGLVSHVQPDPLPEGVTFLTLPPGTTSIFQPMDQGVLIALKKRFRLRMLKEIVSNMETLAPRRAEARAKPAGTAGLADGVDANVGDVCRILKEEWAGFDNSSITNCFLKSNILPTFCVTELQKLPAVVQREVLTIEEICSTGWNRIGSVQAKVMEELQSWLETENDVETMMHAVENLDSPSDSNIPDGEVSDTPHASSPSDAAPVDCSVPNSATTTGLEARLSRLRQFLNEDLITENAYNLAVHDVLECFGFFCPPE